MFPPGYTQSPQSYCNSWELFKAFLRGLLITKVNGVKSKTSALQEQAARLVSQQEVEFVADPSDVSREAWLATQEAVNKLTGSAAYQKRLFNRLTFFEEGEQTGRLLPKIVQASPSIGALCPEGGGGW